VALHNPGNTALIAVVHVFCENSWRSASGGIAWQKRVSLDKTQPDIIPPPHAVTVSVVAPVDILTTGTPTEKTMLCHGCVRQNRVRQIEMKERNTEVWITLRPILVK
jgi:hypothetical protein